MLVLHLAVLLVFAFKSLMICMVVWQHVLHTLVNQVVNSLHLAITNIVANEVQTSEYLEHSKASDKRMRVVAALKLRPASLADVVEQGCPLEGVLLLTVHFCIVYVMCNQVKHYQGVQGDRLSLDVL